MRAELLTQKTRNEPANVIPLEIVEACEVVEIVERPRLFPAVNISAGQMARATGQAAVWIAGGAWTVTKAGLVVSGYVIGGVLLLSVELLKIVLEIVRAGLDRYGYHNQTDVQPDSGQGRTGSVIIINEVRTGAGANVRIENRVI